MTTYINTRRGELTLEDACKWLEINTIVRRFDTWAVTDYGVECLVEYYPIDAARITTTNWIRHMSDKSWMTPYMIGDLQQALTFAEQHFARS